MKGKLFVENLKEIILTPRFYFSVLLVTALFISSRESGFWATSLVFMAYGNFLNGTARTLSYAVACFPFIITFCDDCTNQYIRSVIIRSGVKGYTRSKFAAGFISAFLTLFFGFLLAVSVESFKLPISDPYNPETYVLYGCFIKYGFPLMTLIARTFHYAVCGAMFACLGFVISAVLTNKFVTMVFPFITGYLLSLLSWELPAWLNVSAMSSSNWTIGSSNNAVLDFEIPGITLINFLYTMLFVVTVSVVIYMVFNVLVEKRINGSLNGIAEGE